MNLATFRSNLKTQLAARSGLTAISAEVFQYPPGSLASTKPTLWLGPTSNSLEMATNIGDSTTNYQLSGGGYALVSGASDAEWQAGEANAVILVEQLIAQLFEDSGVNGACDHARVNAWVITPSHDPDTKRSYMDITFTIEILAFP